MNFNSYPLSPQALVIHGPTGSGKTTSMFLTLAGHQNHLQRSASVRNGIVIVSDNAKTTRARLGDFGIEGDNIEIIDANTQALRISEDSIGMLVFDVWSLTTSSHSLVSHLTLQSSMQLLLRRLSEVPFVRVLATADTL